jgi:hypothetical protein
MWRLRQLFTGTSGVPKLLRVTVIQQDLFATHHLLCVLLPGCWQAWAPRAIDNQDIRVAASRVQQ